jgi:signal transduction histidine kinase
MNGNFEALPSMAWRQTGFGFNAAGLFAQEPSSRQADLRLEECAKGRAPIARDLHDTDFQGPVGVSPLFRQGSAQTPSKSLSNHFLTRALNVSRRAIDQSRFALQGLRFSIGPGAGLEKALADLREELMFNGPAQYRVFVMGRTTTLNPELHLQIYFVAREAVTNAMRHSQATTIEAEVQYLRRRLRVVVRDNGRGIDPQALRSRRDSHRGLPGMRERAESIGAQLKVRSRRGAGTEIEISVPIGHQALAIL